MLFQDTNSELIIPEYEIVETTVNKILTEGSEQEIEDTENIVLKATYDGKTYQEISEECHGYKTQSWKEIGQKFWNKLNRALKRKEIDCKVNKQNFLLFISLYILIRASEEKRLSNYSNTSSLDPVSTPLLPQTNEIDKQNDDETFIETNGGSYKPIDKVLKRSLMLERIPKSIRGESISYTITLRKSGRNTLRIKGCKEDRDWLLSVVTKSGEEKEANRLRVEANELAEETVVQLTPQQNLPKRPVAENIKMISFVLFVMSLILFFLHARYGYTPLESAKMAGERMIKEMQKSPMLKFGPFRQQSGKSETVK